MRGNERVISPAPIDGALGGVPAEGVAGDSEAAQAQGKAFPTPCSTRRSSHGLQISGEA